MVLRVEWEWNVSYNVIRTKLRLRPHRRPLCLHDSEPHAKRHSELDTLRLFLMPFWGRNRAIVLLAEHCVQFLAVHICTCEPSANTAQQWQMVKSIKLILQQDVYKIRTFLCPENNHPPDQAFNKNYWEGQMDIEQFKKEQYSLSNFSRCNKISNWVLV